MSFKMNPLTIFRRKVSKINEEVMETSRFVVCIWMFCRVFGLIPIKLRKSKIHGRTTWLASYSTAWAIYSWVMYIVTVGVAVLGYIHFIEKNASIQRKRTKVAMALVSLHILLGIATITVGCSRCVTHATCLIKARKLIEKAQSLIVWSKISKNDDKIYKIVVVLLLCFWNVVMIIGFLSHINHYSHIMRNLPLYEWYFCWVHAISFAMIGVFTTGIYCMKSTLSQINGTLNLIKKNINYNTNFCTTGGCGDLRSKLSSVIEAHRLASKARCLLSRDQAPMLFVMILSTVERTVIFCALLIFDYDMNLPINALFQAVNCFCELCKLLCIVESCHWITKISNEIRMDTTKFLTVIWDFGLRSDLKYCLRRLKDQAGEFTAMDVCKIDRALIATVGGLILTNLIILLQFG